MLEQAHITQTQAGPSRLTREVVPTSDDEDVFFVSQSSDKIGSSLDSARSLRQNSRSIPNGGDDDDEDHELTLPVRHASALRSQSYSSDPSTEVSAPLTALTTDPTANTPRDRRAPATSAPSVSTAPLRSRSESPPLRSISVETGCILSQPTGDGRDRPVERNSTAKQDVIAPDEAVDITIRRQGRSRRESQQSHTTLSLAESLVVSRQSTPLSNPTLHSNSGLFPGDAPRTDAPTTLPIPINLEDDYVSGHEAQSYKTGEERDDQASHRLPTLSPTPEIPSLCNSGRDAAPQPPPPIPHQALGTVSHFNDNPIIEDERIARAAAAQPPTPPRRQLRARNAAQLNPYTLEAIRYQRALIRNDWQDAVVSQREWHRQERKRLAEEAARAQREVQGAHGSEESQSQWLIPSSEPNSPADHEQLSALSSPPVSVLPRVAAEVSALEIDSISPRGNARQSSPSPSQSDRLPELAEMLAKKSKSASRQTDLDPSRHTTYKGSRTMAEEYEHSQSRQEKGPDFHRADEDDVIPLPAPARRKAPLRALSPSDSEAAMGAGERGPTNCDASIVDSSEDERPQPVPVITKPKRRSRWSGDGSSSDSTDYERRFRQLKKMMPAGMARKHIRDLRAMRHGKAYHSDGHVSSSSSGNAADNGSARRHTERAQAESAETIEISDDQDLQPGQTRKRLRRHDSLDGSNALLIEPDSDLSSSSASSVSSLSPGPTTAQLPIDENISNGNKEAEEVDDSPAPWWSANPLDSYVPYRERDAIDRMLSRTGGRKPSSKSTVHRRKSVSQHRQARLDGFVSAHRLRERATGSSRSHLREIDQNERLDQGITIDVSNKDAQQLPKRKKKRRKPDPRVGRATNYSTARGPTVLRNPPLVRPRVRPRLDLDQHDVLFAANPTRARFAPQEIKIDHVSGDEDASDDDGEWQVLSCVVKDSTLVPLPDARLAVPRTRATVGARQVSSLSTTNEAVSSPIRGLRTSPSASSNSAGLARLHAVNDRSPGTPTRPRLGKSLQTVQVRASTSHNPNLAKAAVSDVGANDVWDDFEGISLDFGMHPFTDGQKLNAEGSSLLARLPDLLALSDRLLHREHIPRIWFGDVLRLEETTLDIDMDHDTLASRLPFFVDNLRLRVGRSLGEGQDGSGADARRYARNLIADTGVFLGCWMVRQAQRAENGRTDFASIFRSYRTILERLEQLQASALSLHDSTHSSKACREDRKRICLQLAWMRFELCWRAMAICDSDINNALEPDAPTVESLLSYGRTLMALLLHHGLHRSIRNVRKAAMTGCSTTDIHTSSLNMVLDDDVAQSIDDTTAMWLGVIHAFSSLEHSRGIVDGRLFWTQFEVAFQRWDESMPKRAPLLRSESLWYCLFALGSLSQVSANGQTQATPSLRECWPLVARALSYIVFRSDESKEMAMGWHILAKRDAYVRIILQRCCLLVSEWRWTMQGAEVTLARLFDIFNSHKLADLPTETEHDFVAFLRDFDVEKLSIADVADREATQDPSFHLFVRLLARAGQELREHALDPKDGDRRISRLFSRMTPVRVMPFTRSDVPTSSQRSVLFNHYTVVMLFLHFVPTSSPQRLRQIQSFLPAFKDADFVSQVTCIRAMMYVAVIFRHHRLDLCPVTKWFGETISALRREYEEIESTINQYERHQLQQQSLRQRGAQASSRADAIRMAAIFEHAPARQAALRRKEEVTRLLVVALRSVQHVIRREDLCGDNHGVQTSDQRLPDQLLLSPAWTQQMLEAQISLEPRVGQEVLKCIQTFLLARMRVLQPALTTEDQANTNHADANDVESATLQQKQHMQQARDEESQDSFAELFEADDDFDFEDPLLARLLDGADGSTACDARGTRLETQASEAVSAAAAAAALEKKRWDREFGELIKSTISPSLFQLLSNIYHPDRRMEAAVTGSVDMSLGVTQRLDELPEGGNGANGGSRSRMDRLLKTAQARQFLELVVDCWAGCAQVLVTNGLREWSSYLGFGNESWKRIDDASGRRDVGLRFLQNVLTLDAAAVQRREYEVEFLAVWIQTAVARVLSVQDVYTRSLMEVAKKVKRVPNTLLPLLAVEWRSIISGSSATGERQDAPVGEDAQAELHSLDLDSFTQHRQALLRAMYTVLGSTLANKTTSIGTAYSILSALLSAIRAFVDDTHLDSSSSSSGTSSSSSPLAYLSFCRSTLDDLHAALAASGVISLLHAEYAAAIARLSAKLDNSHNIESEA